MPLPSASVDLIVSFETIEHLPEQREMLAEFRRVLAADGVLVISSPNRPVYNEGGGIENHFHVRELDRAELAALLTPSFPRQAWYAQRVLAQSALWAEGGRRGATGVHGTLGQRGRRDAGAGAADVFRRRLRGDGVALPALPSLSLFDDGALSLWRDYARALARERELAWEELDARQVAEERLAELVPAINALASEREAGSVKSARIDALESALAATQRTAQDAIERLEAALAQAQAAFAREAEAHAQAADAHAREHAALVETRARLAYRESARGWLRYPFAAVRQRKGEQR